MTKVGQGLSAAAAPVVAAGALLLALNSAYAAEMIWTGDFEEGASSIGREGDRDADFVKKLEKEGIESAADVRSGSGMGICDRPREGTYSGRTRILEGGSGDRVRAEIRANAVVKFAWDGPEYWLGVSVCLAEWPSGSDVHSFLQVHAPNEPSNSNCDFAGNALSIEVAKDTGRIKVIDNPSGRSAGTGAFSNTKAVYSYNLRNTIGQWQDFVFRFRLSTKGDGYYNVWHNGTKVASETGLVNVNWKDSCGNVIDKRYSNGPHVGMYGGPNAAGPKTLYLDAARVARGPDGYSLVAPRGSDNAVPNSPSALTVVSR